MLKRRNGAAPAAGGCLKTVLSFILVVTAVGNRSEAGAYTQRSGRTIIHPTAENMPAGGALDYAFGAEDTVWNDSELHDAARRLQAAREVLTIGVEEGPVQEMFGPIVGLQVGEEGNIYVLDSGSKEILVFDKSGNWRYSAGQEGQGPGEFLEPHALKLGPDGRVFVADSERRSLSAFRRTDTGLAVDTTFRLAYSVEDMCITTEGVFVRTSGFHTGNGVIAELLHDGEERRTFGEPYMSAKAIVQSMMSRGGLSCDHAGGHMVATFTNWGVLRGFSPAGERKWTSVISDFQPVRVVDEPGEGDRSVYWRVGDGEMDFAGMPVIMRGSGFTIVQVSRMVKSEDRFGLTLKERLTYLVDVTTGEGVYVGSNYPLIFAFRSDRVYSAVLNPFPQVKVYQIPPSAPE